jgi:predicted aspartyl protease
MVAARALLTCRMFITKRNTLKIKLVLTTTQKTEEALIDSGATENFLDPRTVSKLRLPTEELEKPRSIHNIDGTSNQGGLITRKCHLNIQMGHLRKEMEFFITNLGQDCIILGYPFLQNFNPEINWETGKVHHISQIFFKPIQIWRHCWKVWNLDKRLCLRRTSFA